MNTIVNSIAAYDVAGVLHPFTNLSEHRKSGPFVVKSGKGIYLYDDDGNEYIDTSAGLWSVALGYSERRLIEAASRQMEQLPYCHSFRGTTHDSQVELATKLLELLPSGMSKIFFNNSGSEANDTAIKMVWYYHNSIGKPRKKKIIGLINGYHGITVGAASLSGQATNHIDFDLPIHNIRHADCPRYYRYGKPGESEEDFATRMAEGLDSLIQREGPDTVAAFIAEPVQGGGGVTVPPLTYFQKVQEVLRKHDVLFIADEVICGFGRTGNMFGSETFGLNPDIITMAKALSSSYMPISAVAISETLYDAFCRQSEKIGMFAHGYTHSGHPVCAAVALETLKIYEERDIVGRVQMLAPIFQGGLGKLASNPLVGDVRGVGLMAGVELVRDKSTREPFAIADGVGQIFSAHAERHGLIVRAIGDIIALSPPLIITEAEIGELLARLAKALDDTTATVEARV